jgi:type 1 glutamine amidotransferase
MILTGEITSLEADFTGIGWVAKYGNARTCYIEVGHGAAAMTNKEYRELIARAVRWTAGRLPEGNLAPSNYKPPAAAAPAGAKAKAPAPPAAPGKQGGKE